MKVSGITNFLTPEVPATTPQDFLRKEREKIVAQLSDLRAIEKEGSADQLVGKLKAIDSQLGIFQLEDQYRKMAENQQKLLDETEKAMIKKAKERKDDGVLLSASLRRLISADCKYRSAVSAGGGQMEKAAAEDIQKDIDASNKLGAEAVEIAKKKRQEQFKTDLKKAAKKKQAEIEQQKADEEREAAQKKADIEREKDKAEAPDRKGGKRRRSPLNVTV